MAAKRLRRLVAAGKVRVDAQHVADAGQHLVDAPRRVAREDDEEVVVGQREETGVDLLGFSRQHDADYFEAFRQAREGDQLGQMDMDRAVTATGAFQPLNMVETRLLTKSRLSPLLPTGSRGP